MCIASPKKDLSCNSTSVIPAFIQGCEADISESLKLWARLTHIRKKKRHPVSNKVEDEEWHLRPLHVYIVCLPTNTHMNMHMHALHTHTHTVYKVFFKWMPEGRQYVLFNGTEGPLQPKN